MESLFQTLVIALVVVAVLGGVVVFLVSRLRVAAREMRHIEGEERRMFDFLHHLGHAIEEDYSSRKLYRVMVNGLEDVMGAEGAALYLVSRNGKYLVPAHLSEACPPLHDLSTEQWEIIGGDASRLSSHLRLAKVPDGPGMLWDCLRDGAPRRVTELPAGIVPEAGPDLGREAMLAPVRHVGRDLGVMAVVADPERRRFSKNDFDVFRSAAEQSAFALGNSMIHQEVSDKRRLERELRMASEVQRVLLPAADPELPGYRIHGTNVPARIVSGDYYDYLPLAGGRLGVVIADVSGKGVSAGLIMATCRSAVRALAPAHDSPAAALAAVNRQLFSDMREDMFISMTYAILDEEGRVRLARAGHEPALLFRRASEEFELLKPGGLALGIDDGPVFERVTQDLETGLARGDCLLLYTDGINEAENKVGEEFGKQRLQEVFRENAGHGAEAAVTGLQKALRTFVRSHRQMDDITMIAIEKRL